MSSTTKGKQGTKGQKQIYEENKETLRFYLIMTVVASTFHSAMCYFLFLESTTRTSWVMLIVSVLSELGALQMMRYMSKATFNSTSGQVVDGGMDINLAGGMGEYCKDVVILTAAVHILSVIHSYFWFLYLAGPAYAFYVIWTNFLAPWFFAPSAGGDDTDAEEKKRRKRDRKMVKMR